MFDNHYTNVIILRPDWVSASNSGKLYQINIFISIVFYGPGLIKNVITSDHFRKKYTHILNFLNVKQ